MTCSCYSFIGDYVLVFASIHHQVERWKCAFLGQIWVGLHVVTDVVEKVLWIQSGGLEET